MITINPSDIGLRRIDAESDLFAIMADTGVNAIYIQSSNDWMTIEQVNDFATRLQDAANWLQGQ
jgi:hypothetical protein